MSESLRSPKVVAVEYAPFPLTRESKRETRADEGSHSLWVLKIPRLLFWTVAFTRQKAALFLRPLTLALAGLDTFWQISGEKSWRFIYAAHALTADAVWILRVAAAGLAGFLGHLWHECLNTFGRRLCKRVTLACLFSGVCLCLVVNSFYTLGLEVYLNGESIGFVSSTAEFSRAVEDVSQRAGEILHYPYYSDPDVTYRYTVIDRTLVFNQTQVEERLFSQISDIKRLNVLTVDGDVVAVSSDRAGMLAILDGMLEANNLDGTADSVAFTQDVSITTQWADATLERPLSEIAASLWAATKALYDKAGPEDTLADVARRNGMSEEDLRVLNRLDGVQNTVENQELLVRKAAPFLTVDASLHAQYEEEIPYSSVTVSDDTIYVGDKKVRTQGVPGAALVSVRLLYRNGEEVESIEEGRETILEPVQEVIAEGAKERPKKAPTGKFVYPYYGRLTSKFGYRSLFGGEMHSGLDLAGPTGSPIVAADGGVVTSAGWRNGYGNCVTISHGNGFSTLYGHCSKLLVSEGQAVAKGELIAKVGSTGRSTGPHLHFEIRINGTPVNPLKYLN